MRTLAIWALGATFLWASLASATVSPADGTILFIGDSHSYGAFGATIDAASRTLASDVITEASCGSSPSTWVILPGHSGPPDYVTTICGYWKKTNDSEIRVKQHVTPKIEEELQLYHPDVTVIALGTNVAAKKNPLQERESVEEMMHAVTASGSRCIWIGPPDANSTLVTHEKLWITEAMLRVEAFVHGCSYVSSLELTHYPPGHQDGIHYPPDLAKQWAERVDAIIDPEIQDILRFKQPIPFVQETGR